MREFIRHPSDIPIEFNFSDNTECADDKLSDISEGGLSFQSGVCIPLGSELIVRIPIRTPPFEEKAVVVWADQKEETCDIGVRFIDPSSEFRLRMIEQVCYIEHYKHEVSSNEGRELSGAEAAKEWVMKFAAHFPR